MPRVLIVDDSPTARDVLANILGSDPDLEVVGFARNGLEAVAQVKKLKPDVVTMDLDMPVMDGFAATREIMIEHPTPIVIVSAASRAGEVETAMETLRLGAVNLLLKPVGPSSPEYEARAKEVVRAVKAMAGVFVIRRRRHLMSHQPDQVNAVSPPECLSQPHRIRVIAIAASTGGPPALVKVLGALPTDIAVPILVVQHIAAGFMNGFASWLDEVIALKVKIATDKETLRAATVYFAPQDLHLGVTRTRIRLSDAPPIAGFRPAGTHLFESVADAFGCDAAGVILTGMGDDGVRGLIKVHEAGGVTIAQDEASCVVFGMPRAAVEAGAVDTVLPLDAIGPRLDQLVANRT
ncbi:Chemotaxis response regulator protein-glutamate methylesterase of group 3 operon [Stieleria maiorica]|uniref:Protein-glutamate methylesterase/protein-glutamine glutaminase n=1 Tax=Stieleria maiorica TaxID=2795974 RepID=A0A5B9MEG4_9BACT|nr:chemotaxis-specific protein-glutamate methyltransferase CheB [Stieleria maiorica]QEF98616.1 Chemotaxis response regulator protein-glutamate methylesterase of group 3 operon [Stieleria maiorica]